VCSGKNAIVLPSCSSCGVTADDWMALGWTTSKEDGRTSYLCPDCARRNIRAIEGKLPEEYWR
jgi:predicted RNA-binding Zn-ribbon protein involved in translation (DUF1610 family)